MLVKKQDLLNAIGITEAAHKDLKNSISHVRIADGFGWATDGHRLIKFPVVMENSNSTYEIFIHFKDLKTILKRGKPKKIKGCSHYSVSCEDLTINPEWTFPDLQALLPESAFTKVSIEFRNAIDELLQESILRIVEFKAIDGKLYAASHQGSGAQTTSTYPVEVAIQKISPKPAIELFTTPIAFNQYYLFDLMNTPFDEIAIHNSNKLGQLHTRNSVTAHEALLMATELRARHPMFSWEGV